MNDSKLSINRELFLYLFIPNQSIQFMKINLLAIALIAIVLTSCSSKETKEFVASPVELSGDFLFEGPNTLQAENPIKGKHIYDQTGVKPPEIRSLTPKKAEVEFTNVPKDLVESVLLQIVSKNQEMITVGTLSPIPDGTKFDLQLAEEVDLVPYLKDEECFWVIDANLTQDQMDEITMDLHLILEVSH